MENDIGVELLIEDYDKQHYGQSEYRNSRYSQAISLNNDQQYDDLEDRFGEITFNIRASSKKYQKHDPKVNLPIPDELLPKINQNIPEPQEQDANALLIQESGIITASLFQPQQEDQIFLLAILSSNRYIDEIQMIVENENQPTLLKYSSSEYYFKSQSKYVTVCLLEVKPIWLNMIKIKYKETANMYLWKLKSNKQFLLKNIIRFESVGLFFSQSFQQSKNYSLQNYCILASIGHLSKKTKKLCNPQNNRLNQFYQMLTNSFKPYQPDIKNIFDLFQETKKNISLIEYYLYFIYMVYRQNSVNMIIEFGILDKFQVYKKSVNRLLNKERYNLFSNGKCFKEFVLYVYFLNAFNDGKKTKDWKSLRLIIEKNLLEQNNYIQKMILSRIQVDPWLLACLKVPQINTIIINNTQITLGEYLHYKIIELSQFTTTFSGVQYQKKLSQILIQFLGDLKQKSKLSNVSNQNLLGFEDKIVSLFVIDNKLIISKNKFSEFYANIKFLYRLVPKIGTLLLNSLRKYIYIEIPYLLNCYYESILHALLLKPEIKEQNQILIEFFQNQKLLTFHIVYVLNIWTSSKNQLYNFVTLEFILMKFIALNPSSKDIKIEEIDNHINNYLANASQKDHRRNKIVAFGQRLKEEINKTQGQEEEFHKWLTEFKK